jgi:hypothetical protein
VWSPNTRREGKGARKCKCAQRMGNRRSRKAKKLFSQSRLLQDAVWLSLSVIHYSGLYPQRLLCHRGRDAARTADRSLLTDPPSSNVIAAICLTAKKVSYPHEIIVGPALVGRPSVTLSTLLWMVDSSWSKIEQMLAPCLVDVRIAGSACIYFRPLAGPTGA